MPSSDTAANTREDPSPMASSSTSPPPPPPTPPPLPARIPGAPLPPPSVPSDLSGPRSPPSPPAPSPYKPTWYFFYGSLTNPSWLKKVLSLPSDPVLHPAVTTGYEVLMWGHNKVLVPDEDPGKVVRGVAYLVETQEHADRLAFYETDNYEVMPCEMRFAGRQGGEPTAGEEKVVGSVFMWRGDRGKLERGEFDRRRCMEKLRNRGVR
ncbi:hypothetical protein VTJ83DRAFT_6885 [Remersonia thermophila]|uniref:Putative gamma-glutamylcyclotransferase n=1 Tax=Remersonia thermophila TaxID=72144 RepID=A0ABR4D6T4_9PEZI